MNCPTCGAPDVKVADVKPRRDEKPVQRQKADTPEPQRREDPVQCREPNVLKTVLADGGAAAPADHGLQIHDHGAGSRRRVHAQLRHSAVWCGESAVLRMLCPQNGGAAVPMNGQKTQTAARISAVFVQHAQTRPIYFCKSATCKKCRSVVVS